MGSFSPNWYWVQEELASTVRSVAYDRAGLGWSRHSRRPRDAQTIAMELRDALHEAAIEPPYVLAGHSFGGLPVRAFADLYPELTAGLVLVDASHPDQWVRWPTPHADKMIEVSQRIFGWLGWLGVLRALNLSRGVSAGLPARQVAELRAGAALPGFAATEAAQIRLQHREERLAPFGTPDVVEGRVREQIPLVRHGHVDDRQSLDPREDVECRRTGDGGLRRTAGEPGNHTDPGPHWDWDRYIELVRAAGPR